MKIKSRSLIFKFGSTVAALALFITNTNVNTACFWLVHQPKLPKGADKLRKY